MINTNNDLISRKAAIDALKHDAEVLGIEPFDEGYTPFDAIQTLHDLSTLDCPSGSEDVIFGNGKGTDNICACSKYKPSTQLEQPEIQDILDYLDTVLHPILSPDHWNVYAELHDMISMLSFAQPELYKGEEMTFKPGDVIHITGTRKFEPVFDFDDVGEEIE